jgi:hypothetical protein
VDTEVPVKGGGKRRNEAKVEKDMMLGSCTSNEL